MKRIFLILIMVVLFFASAAAKPSILKTERDFQLEFHRVYFNGRGKLEVPVKYGRIDILTKRYAVEVDRLSKFHEGIGQCLHYAHETNRKPGLAIFVPSPRKKDLKKMKYVKYLCSRYGITFWYINDEIRN